MPVEESLLFHNFVSVDDLLSGKEALQRAARQEYIVIRFADRGYAVATTAELRTKLDQWERWGSLDLPLGEFYQKYPNALEPYFTGTIQQDFSDPSDQARLDGLKEDEILVVLSGEEVVGLLIKAKTERSVIAKGGFVLSVEEETEPAERFILAEVRDRRGQWFDAKKQPLQQDQTYNLVFDIDTEKRMSSLAAERFAQDRAFEAGEDEIELTVRLSSDDFMIRPEEQILYVPKTGKSLNEATFFIKPLQDGPCVVNAIFLKKNNFIQLMTLKFYAGELFKVESAGRSLEASLAVPPRDVNLTILNMGNGFQVVMTGAVAATATLPLTLPQLDYMVGKLRKKLLEIVDLEVGGNLIYQADINIPEEIHRLTSLTLATEGFRLYQNIFFGPAADEQTKNLGRKMVEMARRDRLNIQIFSKEFMLPWGLLYLAEQRPRSPEEVDGEAFLGLKHIIEQIPLQPAMQVLESSIDARQGLQVGLVVNEDIDTDMKLPLIADQLRDWDAIQKDGWARVNIRRTGDELLRALENTDTTLDQVMYFYCHAVSRSLLEGDGPDASTLLLTGKQRLTLGDLKLDAGPSYQLPGNPLVFINACQSAELSPMFYDGFVPYFMAKGARGVIGTESDTPALFAKEWAKRFFEHFLKGERLGEIVLNLRREFYFEHNNIMGLLYAIYVDGDTCLMGN